MFPNREIAVATKTKTSTVTKTFLAIAVVTASLTVMSAFAMVVGTNAKALAFRGLVVRISANNPAAQTVVGPATDVTVMTLRARSVRVNKISVDQIKFIVNKNFAPNVITNPRLVLANGQVIQGRYNVNNRRIIFNTPFFVNKRFADLTLKVDIPEVTAPVSLRTFINPSNHIKYSHPRISSNKLSVKPARQFKSKIVTVNSPGVYLSFSATTPPDNSVLVEPLYLDTDRYGNSIDVDIAHFDINWASPETQAEIGSVKLAFDSDLGSYRGSIFDGSYDGQAYRGMALYTPERGLIADYGWYGDCNQGEGAICMDFGAPGPQGGTFFLYPTDSKLIIRGKVRWVSDLEGMGINSYTLIPKFDPSTIFAIGRNVNFYPGSHMIGSTLIVEKNVALLPDLTVNSVDLFRDQNSSYDFRIEAANLGGSATPHGINFSGLVHYQDGYVDAQESHTATPFAAGGVEILEFRSPYVDSNILLHGPIVDIEAVMDHNEVFIEGDETNNSLRVPYQATGTSGVLTVEVAPNRPEASQFVAGTTGNTMMSYKFSATDEVIDVTMFHIATTSATAQFDIDKVKLYANDQQIGAASGYTLDSAGDILVNLTPGTFLVPEGGSVDLTIKVDLSHKALLVDSATFEIGLGDDDGDDSSWGADGSYYIGSYLMTATGINSGVTIDPTNINSTGDNSGSVAASRVHYFYDGLLTVSLNPASPSGIGMASTNKEVLRIDLTAIGDDITIDNIEVLMNGSANIVGTGIAYWKSNDMGTTYATFAPGTTWLNPNSDFDVLNDDNDGAWDNTLIIAAGTTKTIKLFGDTNGASTSTTLQANVQGSTNTISGVQWHNYSGNRVDFFLTKNLPVNGGTFVY